MRKTSKILLAIPAMTCLVGCNSYNFKTKTIVYCVHHYYGKTSASFINEICEGCKPAINLDDSDVSYTDISYNRGLIVEQDISAMNKNGWFVVDYSVLLIPCDGSGDGHYKESASSDIHKHYLVTYGK